MKNIFFAILFFLLGMLGIGFNAKAFSLSPLKFSATVEAGDKKD